MEENIVKEEFEGQNRTADKKVGKGVTKYILIGLATIVLLAGGSVFAYSQTPAQRVDSGLSLGNKYLNEVDYEEAVAEFNKVLEIEPENREALLGIMEASANLEDEEMFRDAFGRFFDIYCDEDETSKEDWRLLTKMTLAAERFYEEDEYKEILQSLLEEKKNKNVTERYIAILNREADSAWRDRDYEKAIALLEEAYRLDSGNEQIERELIKTAAEYIEYCRKNQQYDDGLDCIAKIRDMLNNDHLFQDQEKNLTAVQDSDSTIQEMLNQLNAYFEADNIEGIQDIMEGEIWDKQTDNISRVFYSENLLEQDDISGKGTGVYRISGDIYVYYGNFENGIRQGQGLWYYASDDGTLVKYDLNWENGIPQGEGTCDQYSTLTMRGYGGVTLGEEKIHDIESFHVTDGFFDGEYSEIINKSNAQGSMEAMYVRGIGQIIDMPAEIAVYFNPGEQIIGKGDMSDGSYVWKYYSPSPRRINGVWNPTQYSVAEITLE